MSKDFTTRTLGIHYRGTDKPCEAVYVSKADFIKQISALLTNEVFTTLFITSDETAFITQMKETFPSYHILHTQSERSNNDEPIHKTSKNPDLAKMAMIDSLLLSKCDFVIKTSSCLSDWVKIWNPSIPVFNVNKYYHVWFPQAMIPVRSFI
jgi:hypothetical protein